MSEEKKGIEYTWIESFEGWDGFDEAAQFDTIVLRKDLNWPQFLLEIEKDLVMVVAYNKMEVEFFDVDGNVVYKFPYAVTFELPEAE